MTSLQPRSAVDLVVALDYGQFYLETDDPPEDLPQLVDSAFDQGVAAADGTVVILSPHQNNFAMPLRVEIFDAAPPEDLDDWQEAVEVHVDVTARGLYYGSPTVEFVQLPVPPGSYRVLVTGRGFVAIGWPGSTEPGDEWRLRFWPDPGPDEPRRIKSFDLG